MTNEIKKEMKASKKDTLILFKPEKRRIDPSIMFSNRETAQVRWDYLQN